MLLFSLFSFPHFFALSSLPTSYSTSLHSTPTQRDSTQLYSPRCAAPVKCGDDDDVDDALDRSQQQNRKWRQGQGKHRVAEGKWEGERVGSACQATLSITNLALITYSTTPKSMACPGGPNLVGLAGLSRPQGILVKANCRLLIRSWLSLWLLLSLSLSHLSYRTFTCPFPRALPCHPSELAFAT